MGEEEEPRAIAYLRHFYEVCLRVGSATPALGVFSLGRRLWIFWQPDVSALPTDRRLSHPVGVLAVGPFPQDREIRVHRLRASPGVLRHPDVAEQLHRRVQMRGKVGVVRLPVSLGHHLEGCELAPNVD